MKISLSVAAQDRQFAKAVRRVRPDFVPLFDAFSKVKMVDPIHEAILIGLTDSKPNGYFKEIPNQDGYFQVLAGVTAKTTDHDLKVAIFDLITRAVQLCPFSKADKEEFTKFLAEWERNVSTHSGQRF